MKKYIFLFTIFGLSLQGSFLRDNINEVVFDTTTHLMWQDDYYIERDSKKTSWIDGINYCENLDKASYTDWKMPNINELITIIDLKANTPAIDSTFRYATSEVYWSSTTSKSKPTHTWGVDFEAGSIKSEVDKSTLNHTRCVRKYK